MYLTWTRKKNETAGSASAYILPPCQADELVSVHRECWPVEKCYLLLPWLVNQLAVAAGGMNARMVIFRGLLPLSMKLLLLF